MMFSQNDLSKTQSNLVLTRGGSRFPPVVLCAYPDLAHSQAYENQPGIADEEQAASWRPVVEAVHRAGGRIICQLMHAGALVQYNRFVREAIAPSAVKPKGRQLEEHGGSGEFAVPREMTREEIDAVISGFAAAARRAKQVGFDGVEVHAANGYLLDQFLSEGINLRTDEYGGPAANRVRLTVQVLEAIRHAADRTSSSACAFPRAR